ncbi:MAG TPA: hypothetical protein VGQ62_13090 [Chloroflexota bacterium]|nr:hypothetical protein [Chloroflexota bacterium]
MSIDHQVQAEYEQARRKASWRNIVSRLTGQRNELLRFEEVRRQLRAQGRRDAGARPVPLDAIVGSVGRYRDFDAAFLPRQTQTKGRWLSIDRAHHEEVSLPPVELYRLGETYFVKDGNHRVSVARERGQVYVDATVIELQAAVPIGSLAELEEWIGRQDAVAFLSTTRLLELRPTANVFLTLPGQYERLLEHISVHRWFLGVEADREISYPDAVASWYDHVYLPLVQGIREASVLREFPKRTEADLYLWLIEHLWYLREEGALDEDMPLDAAARLYAGDFSQRPTRRLVRGLQALARLRL